MDAAQATLRHAAQLGINHVDTADAYGPETVEHLIRKALHPYDGIVIATKGGLTRQGPNKWSPVGRPEYLRQCIEMSLRRLAVDTIDLYYLHRIDQKVPMADQLEVLAECQHEGKIRSIGLSKVSVAQLEEARRHVEIVAVQNKFSLWHQEGRDVIERCNDLGIAFVPYAPLGAGQVKTSTTLKNAAKAAGVTPGQLALAWLLNQGPHVLPIPGGSRNLHITENVAAASVEVPQQLLRDLTANESKQDRRQGKRTEAAPAVLVGGDTRA